MKSNLPPSAKFILKILHNSDKPMTINEIMSETGLPERTVKYALRRLRELKLVDTVPCFKDFRRKYYYLCYEAI